MRIAVGVQADHALAEDGVFDFAVLVSLEDGDRLVGAVRLSDGDGEDASLLVVKEALWAQAVLFGFDQPSCKALCCGGGFGEHAWSDVLFGLVWFWTNIKMFLAQIDLFFSGALFSCFA